MRKTHSKRQEEMNVENLNTREQGLQELLKLTLAGTSTYEFYYYPKEARLIHSKRLCTKFGFDEVLEDVPNCFEWMPIIFKDYKKGLIKAFHSILNGKKRETFIFKTLDEMFWIRATISVIAVDEEGYPTYAVGILEDITREKEHEKKARTLEQRSDEILMAVSSLYFAINSVDLNNNKIKLIRCSNEVSDMDFNTDNYSKVIEQIVDKFYHPEDKERFLKDFSIKNLNKCWQIGSEQYTGEYRRKIGDEWRWISVVAFFINKEIHYKNVILALRDVNEQHVHQEKERRQEEKKEDETKRLLEDALNRAERASEAKSEFFSRMSHDIRTPMNAILGMTVLAEKHIDDKEKTKEYIDKINLSGRHLMDLINEVLDMSKIESGNMHIEASKINLKKLVQETLSIMNPLIDVKKQELIVDISNIEHEIVSCDKVRFQKVLDNLLTNANKYTPENGAIHFIMEELPEQKKSAHRRWFRFIVKDTGIGIEEDYLPHIFEPFSRASDSRTSKIVGTGLGMTITYNIVNMMNGEIKVESKIGEGSTFTVMLPLEIQERYAVEKIEENSNIKKSFAGKRILLVEDNELNLEIAQEMIQMLECIVETAENGEKGVEKFKNAPPNYYDLIFMDVRMPIMDGYEATKKIRGLNKEDALNVPIIAMSADAFSEDIRKALNSGMNEHLSKPINMDSVARIMSKWI